ncbi:GWxTD domain-containing protein [candidate division KSB1 bacterium]|nr:GWxTD domain-containing protein [candidate division KSB1 bacterium]
MKKRFTLLFALFLVVTALSGSAIKDLPATSEGNLQFYLDYARFVDENRQETVEFYLQVYADQVQAIRIDSLYIAQVNISSTFYQKEHQIVNQRQWNTKVELPADGRASKTLVFYDQWSEIMSSSLHFLRVTVEDQNSGNFAVADLDILPLPPQLQNSDIEFISSVKPGFGTSPFFKKGRLFIPNPSRRYGVLNPNLQFYYELYPSRSSADSLELTYSIQDQSQTEIKSFTSIKKAWGRRIEVTEAFDVDSLKSDIYELVITATAAGMQSIVLKRHFEIVQIDFQAKATPEQQQQIDRLIRLFEILAPVATVTAYDQADPSSGFDIVAGYWKRQDPNPVTLVNEFLQQAMTRYRYANEHFGWAKREGWQTDRGKILIKYGMPDEINRFANEADMLPHEIWVYQIDKNYHFIFGDLRADGHYVLLHSNKEDELHNLHWRDWLRKM